jgi:succinate--hydroxymethylglutarate CoA-transferase
MLEEIEHPTIGPLKLAGIPVKFSDTQPSIRSPPPILNQHTREVLMNELGYSDSQIQHLVQIGAIGLPKVKLQQ